MNRRDVMAVLASAEAGAIDAAWARLADKPEYRVVRGPDVGLVMVRGRAGGGGRPFNLGEVTVTRATVQLAGGGVGHAYCLGREPRKSVQSAVLDALWQADGTRARVEAEVIAPPRADAEAAEGRRRAERRRRGSTLHHGARRRPVSTSMLASAMPSSRRSRSSAR